MMRERCKTAFWGLLGLVSLSTALVAVPAFAVSEWVDTTVWPARAPVTISLELEKAGVVTWITEEQGRPAGQITDADVVTFVATAAHAAGAQVGDVDEALARREAVEVEGDLLRVSVVGAHTVAVIENEKVLRESQLFQRAKQVSCTVDAVASKGALAIMTDAHKHAQLLRGRPGDLETVFRAIRALASEDLGVLAKPSLALDAWAAGPGNGTAVQRLAATQAIGVYKDPDSETYGAWNAKTEKWATLVLLTGTVVEGDQPVGGATVVAKLAPESPVKQPTGRLDSVASGPDGSFMLVVPGVLGEKLITGKAQFEVFARKWGYKRARHPVGLGGTRVVDCGAIALEPIDPGKPKVPETSDLMLDLPDGYRALAETTYDNGGYQRFLRVQYAPVPGSNRLYTSSTEITYSFERVEPDADSSAWVQSTLNASAAEWNRRSLSTRELTAKVLDSSEAGGQTLVQESGQWPSLLGATVYHSSESRIVALVSDHYRARMQVTAVGSGNSAAVRDPAGVVAGVEELTDDLSGVVRGKMTTTSTGPKPLALGANWLAAERMNRALRTINGLESGTARMEDKQERPIVDVTPIARQVITIEGDAVMFPLGGGVEVIAEPASRLRISPAGELKLMGGRFTVKTPEPDEATGAHLRQLIRIITPEGDEDLVRAVKAAVNLKRISPAYGEELQNLGRDSILRSVFTTCRGLASAETLMVGAPIPVLIFGESELLLETTSDATLNCKSGMALLGESAFGGLVGLSGGEASSVEPGKEPTTPAVG